MYEIAQLIVCIVGSRHGQGMVEYALIAGFVSVSAGAVLPGFSDGISTIFSRTASVLSAASA